MGFKPEAMTTLLGLTSTEPLRLAGLESVFRDHPSIGIAVGDLDRLLLDCGIGSLILDVSDQSKWMEVQLSVRSARPDIKLIVLGPAGDEELALRSIAAGARAYLDRNSGPLAVRQAVEAVLQGFIWAPRRQLSMLIDRLMSQKEALAPVAVPTFSRRERQVLDLIMKACSNREIAEELGIEERTVKAYVASLLRKTGVDNRVLLSVRATRDSLRSQGPIPS